MTKPYRRKHNRDTWHFCANCRHWPQKLDDTWIGSVQGAVATWSNHRNQKSLEISVLPQFENFNEYAEGVR